MDQSHDDGLFRWAWNRFKDKNKTLVLLALCCHHTLEPELSYTDLGELAGLDKKTIRNTLQDLTSTIEGGQPLLEIIPGGGRNKTRFKINYEGGDISQGYQIYPPQNYHRGENYPLQNSTPLGTKPEKKNNINNKHITNSKYINVINTLRDVEKYNLSEDKEVSLIGWLGAKNISVDKAEDVALSMVNKISSHISKDGDQQWKHKNREGNWVYYKTVQITFQKWVSNQFTFSNPGSKTTTPNLTDVNKFD